MTNQFTTTEPLVLSVSDPAFQPEPLFYGIYVCVLARYRRNTELRQNGALFSKSVSREGMWSQVSTWKKHSRISALQDKATVTQERPWVSGVTGPRLGEEEAGRGRPQRVRPWITHVAPPPLRGRMSGPLHHCARNIFHATTFP